MTEALEKNIRKVVPYVPGEQPQNPDVIKLNTNENPYSPAPGVARVLKSMDADLLRLYPDPTNGCLVKALADMGVEPIEAVGKPFDPNLHNAVMHVEDENLGENTVAQEFQKGYLYHGSVVRHSMVQVAN